MKSIRRAHIVVVAECGRGMLLAARLRRMDVAWVTAVNGLDQARRLCQSGGADLCLVAFGGCAPDAVPAAGAPGRGTAAPSLLLADIVTPHLRKLARRSGYRAVVPASIVPRLFYRRIGAALQGRRAARRNALPRIVPSQRAHRTAELGSPTLH
jgi:hypothetical protein